MQYKEFLRLAGATEKECQLGAYQKYIEPAYMNNDDIFPTKDEVINYWHRFGLLGFTPDSIKRLRKAVDAVRDVLCYSNGYPRFQNTQGIIDLIGNAATTAQ